jgi:putative peptidoglycan lipid II flippase
VEPGPDALAARDTPDAQLRSSAAISSITLGSRVLGFARVVVVAGVLGSTFLGDTYQSANAVPNLVFELVAAGALSAVLVPSLVDLLHRGAHAEAERLAGNVLGCTLVLMVALVAIGFVAAEPAARLLFIAEPDPQVREAQVRLGTFFLWFFLPQTLFYGLAMVLTGVLHAHRRFAVPAAAPIWNNVVVIGVYVAYGAAFGQTDPTDVSTGGKLLLAAGTTVGVVALAVPQWPFVRRLGFRLRPRFGWRDPALRRVLRHGMYAVGYLGLNNVVFMVMVVLSNATSVVAFHVAWAFFLLPFALFATALATAAFPALSRMHGESDAEGFGAEAVRLLGAIAFTTVPVGVAYGTLAGPLSNVFRIGNISQAGAAALAAVLTGLALAVPCYGLFLGLTRIAYARHDTAWPTVCNAVGITIGIAIMLVLFAATNGDTRMTGLGVGLAVGYWTSCALLAARHLRRHDLRVSITYLGRCLVAGAAMAGVVTAVEYVTGALAGDVSGRIGAALTSIVAASLGAGAYLGVAAALRVPALGMLRSVMSKAKLVR